MPQFSIPPSHRGTAAKMQKPLVVVPSKAETLALERIANSPLRVNKEKLPEGIFAKQTYEYLYKKLNPHASPISQSDSRSSESRKPTGKKD